MKTIAILIICTLLAGNSNAQSDPGAAALKLSADIFRWETNNQIDSLETVFHDQFVVVSSSGESQVKSQYLQRLKSGNFVHNSIDVEQNTATVTGNTAVVTGKGKFTVTVSGNKVTLYLLYMEVFTRDNAASSWKILAMQASRLPQ